MAAACPASPALSLFLNSQRSHSPNTPLLSTSETPLLCRKYFLAWSRPRQWSYLCYLHTFGYCSWKDLKGGFTSKKVMCFQGSRTLEILYLALECVFPLPWVAGLIWGWGYLNRGGTHASVSVFLCLKQLLQGLRIGSFVDLREHQVRWNLMSAPWFLRSH